MNNSYSRVQIFILPHFVDKLSNNAGVQDEVMQEQIVTWGSTGKQNINSCQNISARQTVQKQIRSTFGQNTAKEIALIIAEKML